MPFPISIPYAFQLSTASLPLSQLDSNFSTLTTALNGVASGSYSLGAVNITGGTITGITPLAVAYGGSGVSTSSGANSLVLRDSNSKIVAGNGTSGTQVVNFSQFPATLGVPGSSALPNGLIMQWGAGVTYAGTTTITFPTAFPNVVFGAFLTINGATGPTSQSAVLINNGLSTTTLIVDSAPGTSIGFYWLVLGY